MKLKIKERIEVLLFRLLGHRRWDKVFILRKALPNCLGRIRAQFAKAPIHVSLGPYWQVADPPSRHPRTLARKAAVEKLRATYPWVDMQDLEIFLAGFDAGEDWAAFRS